MQYRSTGNAAPQVSFREAVFAGLAPDGGLYLPVEIPRLPPELTQSATATSFVETATALARPFVGDEMTAQELGDICADAFSFDLPLVRIVDDVFSLELFWGPTFAFKDFGARFLARVMRHFATQGSRKLTILVATSGDTGSAVANGFYGMEAIEVVLLYPSGRVSPLQEKQLTTLGGNVTAVEVQGTFDDCQAMVKAMFADPSVSQSYRLSSANSINIGRLLPQIFYWVHAWQLLGLSYQTPAYICVPSGNFGNVTGALIAHLMGLPVPRIVVGTNDNDVVPRYLSSGEYVPAEAVQTPASAMDVGNPSNFRRILDLLGGSHQRVAEVFCGFRVSTPEMLATIKAVLEQRQYLLDPHSAVGVRALQRFFDEQPHCQAPGVAGATAHPAKFAEAIREATGTEVEIPPALAAALAKEKKAELIRNRPQDLRELLLDTASA